MVAQTELLIKSIKKFSGNKSNYFSLVLQGYDQSKIIQPLPLIPTKISNRYISENAEILYCPYFWEKGTPCRWFIQPKSETCILIDVDMVACKDLSPLYNLDKNKIHGTTAFANHLNEKEWSSIDLNEKDRPFYFNHGLIIVPSKNLQIIGKQLFEIYPDMQKRFTKHAYYSGQISLTYIIKKMQLNRNLLPKNYNWFDSYPFQEMKENPFFIHYFRNSNKNKNLAEPFSNLNNPYVRFMLNNIYSFF